MSALQITVKYVLSLTSGQMVTTLWVAIAIVAIARIVGDTLLTERIGLVLCVHLCD